MKPIPLTERQPLPSELAPSGVAPWPADVGGWCWAWDAREGCSWDVAWPEGRNGDSRNWMDLNPKYVTHFAAWNELPTPFPSEDPQSNG